MSYDEKLLREFVRHALEPGNIDEVLTGKSKAVGGESEYAGVAAMVGAPIQKKYEDRYGYGQAPAERAEGLLGVLGMPKSGPELWGALFGEYSGGWCTALDADGGSGTCPGLFPAIKDLATSWGRKILDMLFKTTSPHPTNATAERFGSALFPTLRSYYQNPTPGRFEECNTIFEMSMLLEQDAASAEGILSAVKEDLANIENAISILSRADDLLELASGFQGLTGDPSGTADLSSAMSSANEGEGISDSDFGEGGISGVITEFVNSIAKPFLSSAVSDMRDQVVNIGLPPDVESSIKSAFDSTIRKIS